MRRSYLGQLGPCLLITLFGGFGCGDSNPPNNAPVECTPTCREGFTCVNARCVSACNPPCEGANVCDVSTGAPRCVPPSDAGAAIDVNATVDAGNTDLPPAASDTNTLDSRPISTDADPLPSMDATVPGDTGAPSDTVILTDRGAADTGADAGPCGNPGEPCCNGRACLGGGACSANRCVAPMREMGECTSPNDCTGGQQCQGIFECAGMRGCWRCAASSGARAFGERCTMPSECQSNLCSAGRCSVPCALGASGDTSCSTRGEGYVCTATYYRPNSTAPITTLGVCQQRCQRNADCPAQTTCLPSLNYLTDRMDFYCAPTSRTGAIGAACDPNGTATCQSGLCLPSGMNTGFCTAPCISESDCTTAAPVCGQVFWVTPSGATQQARGCVPRS